MSQSLPSTEELGKLPIRAIVAYAVRNARRITSELRDIIEEELLDDAFKRIDAVTKVHVLTDIDRAGLISAAERVVAAYENAPATLRSPVGSKMVFAVVHAAISGMYGHLAATNPASAQGQLRRAAQAAFRAALTMNALDGAKAMPVRHAAIKDYETLLNQYGRHDDVVIGDPIECFGE